MNTAPVLAYQNVGKRFGRTTALHGVSLEVAPGEVFGLLGPNGAGKTTLIRIGLDIVRADEGSVRLVGAPLSRAGLDRVSYLPEERGLYKKTKVRSMLAYLGELKGLGRRAARERAEAWLARVGLSHVATQNVETLSKGMSQKVQLAGALMTDPELVVLDEPFSGLDPINVELVKALIAERRAARRTTILSTHLMNQVEALCDRVGVVHRGALVVYGTLDDVRRRHAPRAARLRLQHGTLPDPLPPSLAAHIEAVSPDGIFQQLRLAPDSEAPAVLRALVAAGLPVAGFDERLATMEEIFLASVGASKDALAAAPAEAAQ